MSSGGMGVDWVEDVVAEATTPLGRRGSMVGWVVEDVVVGVADMVVVAVTAIVDAAATSLRKRRRDRGCGMVIL